ncbi:hypothetical protein [Paraburkholderia sp. SIMBA_054]|uniref:hypothetical protein n=1 Tax=Paraburkholderia sp. SIMBA_054 TaxID=3085795 RepID=UPI0039786D01
MKQHNQSRCSPQRDAIANITHLSPSRFLTVAGATADVAHTLPRQLVVRHASGSLVIFEPDPLGRTGCGGPTIVWLKGDYDDITKHAEAIALARSGDADEILAKWEGVVKALEELTPGGESAARNAIDAFATLITTVGQPVDGAERLLSTARAIADTLPRH